MHLLATEPGIIADGSAAIDLAQTQGDIIVLASADTEIALLAAAQARRHTTDPAAPCLRLAPVMRLGHNFSVDLYMERVGQARLVVARLLGGSAYWPYGVERLVETCRKHRIPLALLPGDDKPDSELARLSTVPPAVCRRLWRYLAEGGPGNAGNFLRYAASLIGEDPGWAEPAPLLRAGFYWPGRALPGLADIAAEWRGDGGVAPIVFYRALAQSGNTAPVDALVEALLARRLRPLPIFVHSLKEPQAALLLGEAFAAYPPDVILNASGFSVAAAGGADPLQAGCPVLQVVFAGGDEESWREGTRGLGPRDLAMNVALPEIDGRIFSRAVSFKAPLGRDPETEADLVGYRPVADRIAFVANLARNWAHLRAKPPAERRVAIILANYPNRDGRIGNGVGLDTPQSAVGVLSALGEAGYRTGEMPPDGATLMERLLAGPTNARPRAPAEETLSFADYSSFFGSLPRAVQERVEAQWGAAERDPFFRPGRVDCGRFAIPGFWSGNVAVLVQPARGYNLDPKASYHDPALVPPHSYFAAYAWLSGQLPRRSGDRPWQARHPRMAARQGARAVVGMFSGGGAGPVAASLSVHRQRSRRGQPSQAAFAGGHHRPSDPALDARRQLWPAGRARAPDRRILRGLTRRPAPRRAARHRDPGARPSRRDRPRLRHRRRRGAAPRPAKARRVPVRT